MTRFGALGAHSKRDDASGRERVAMAKQRGGDEAAGPARERSLTHARDFEIVLERASGMTTLVLAGELDLYRAPEIEDALAQAIESEWNGDAAESPSPDGEVRRLAVDLRAVTFLDSTTLVLLLNASHRQDARGGELLVLVGPQTPTTVFEVTGFDRLLTIRRVAVDQGAA
ncbi:MAG TPA: STAS domain-containing protein [Gaiellaceae bacterium]|nr:STAS domain-containing protein [Gaiellaceae bacterium]